MKQCLFDDSKTTLTEMPAQRALLIMNNSLRLIGFEKELSLQLSPDDGSLYLEHGWRNLQEQPNFINHTININEAYSTLRMYFHHKRKTEEDCKKEKDNTECAVIINESLNNKESIGMHFKSPFDF